MRGLLVNKPYETGINSFLGDTIELGVISPKLDTAIFYHFLEDQNSQIKSIIKTMIT